MTASAGPSLLAGVDVGGSKIAVLLVDRELRPVHRHEIETGRGDGTYAVDRITEGIRGALAAAGRDPSALAAIGVGVPGRVDPEAGSVTLAVNLGWHELALGPALATRFGVPVAVENDVRAAAAWLHARDAGDPSDLAYVAVGTGISAGVILDGRLHRGPRGLAGEIGHVVLEQGGPRCMCGLDGCLEALASGRGIASIVTAALAAGASSSLAGREPVTTAAVYEAARDGDPLALEVVNAAGAHLARAIHELVMAYDVPRVILGGGVARAASLFLDPVTRGLDDLRSRSALAREALPARLIELLPPDADPGCWGAVFLARTAAGHPAGAPTDATGQEVLAS